MIDRFEALLELRNCHGEKKFYFMVYECLLYIANIRLNINNVTLMLADGLILNIGIEKTVMRLIIA